MGPMPNPAKFAWSVTGTIYLIATISGLVIANVFSSTKSHQITLTLPPPAISADGIITNQVLRITDSARHSLPVSFGHQIYSNTAWHPPKESLFRTPMFELRKDEKAVG